MFSVVISISGSVKYSDATHRPFSGPEGKHKGLLRDHILMQTEEGDRGWDDPTGGEEEAQREKWKRCTDRWRSGGSGNTRSGLGEREELSNDRTINLKLQAHTQTHTPYQMPAALPSFDLLYQTAGKHKL